MRSVPVNCQTHSAAVLFSRVGGSGDTPSSSRMIGRALAFDGCDRAIPKILIGRESDILSDKSNSYELLGKDIKIAG